MRLRIENGDWLPGDRIPTIEALQSDFGMSRATIREALGILEDEALIERHRGRGTFVRDGIPERRLHILPVGWNELIDSLKTIVSRMIEPERDEAQDALTGHISGRPSGSYRRFRRVHSRDDAPYCLIDIHLRADVFASNPDRFRNEPVVLVLAEAHRSLIDTVRQTVTFSIADADVSDALRIPLGAPVVEIRRTITDTESVVVAHTYARYPGEYVRLDFEFDIGASPSKMGGKR